MIGSIIGGAVSAVGSIAGGIAQSKAAKKQSALIDQQQDENEAWYKRRYNEDSTQRADAQQAMQKARDAMQEQTQRAKSAGVVAGATDQSVAMQKASANQAMASTASNIAVAGDARKDAIESQYLATKADLNNQKSALYGQQGENIGNAIAGVAEVGAGIASAFDCVVLKKVYRFDTKIQNVFNQQVGCNPLADFVFLRYVGFSNSRCWCICSGVSI